MRALAPTSGWAVLLLDFANAFNTVDRDLMMSLAAKSCPEFANLTWWLYKLEPRLVTNNGHIIRSSTGTQQGCRLSNPLFALTMRHIAGLLKNIDGLRKPLFFWDDTALIGSPDALMQAASVIQQSAEATGLRLKWKKCHLYGSPEIIATCNSLAFPPALTTHNDYNMEYLKAPIGDANHVASWLERKMQKLQRLISMLSSMPFKHEAATLLTQSASICRVVYLMRILPPRQISGFINEYDSRLRHGYEEILGTPMPDSSWEVAKLPPKYGGMGWRSGLHTFGAHYITSLAKTATAVSSIAPAHNPEDVARQETDWWLAEIAPSPITADKLVKAMRSPNTNSSTHPLLDKRLSIAQQCDAWRWGYVRPKLSSDQRRHVLAHSGSTNWWVSCPPLTWKHWDMPPAEWNAAVRRRLLLDVIPSPRQCSHCVWQLCDTKGNHAVMCKGGPSRILRHNALRDTLAKAIKYAGFTIELEHGGGLDDGRKPGDIIVYNWRERKHLLIDVGVTNPLALHNLDSLLEIGPGGGARQMGAQKRAKYSDLDFNTYSFLPFVLESGGAIGEPALRFCARLREITKSKCISGRSNIGLETQWSRDLPNRNWVTTDPLLVSLSVLLQTHNGLMITERQPNSQILLDSKIDQCRAATLIYRGWASKKLEELNSADPTALERVYPRRPDNPQSGMGGQPRRTTDSIDTANKPRIAAITNDVTWQGPGSATTARDDAHEHDTGCGGQRHTWSTPNGEARLAQETRDPECKDVWPGDPPDRGRIARPVSTPPPSEKEHTEKTAIRPRTRREMMPWKHSDLSSPRTPGPHESQPKEDEKPLSGEMDLDTEPNTTLLPLLSRDQVPCPILPKEAHTLRGNGMDTDADPESWHAPTSTDPTKRFNSAPATPLNLLPPKATNPFIDHPILDTLPRGHEMDIDQTHAESGDLPNPFLDHTRPSNPSPDNEMDIDHAHAKHHHPHHTTSHGADPLETLCIDSRTLPLPHTTPSHDPAKDTDFREADRPTKTGRQNKESQCSKKWAPAPPTDRRLPRGHALPASYHSRPTTTPLRRNERPTYDVANDLGSRDAPIKTTDLPPSSTSSPSPLKSMTATVPADNEADGNTRCEEPGGPQLPNCGAQPQGTLTIDVSISLPGENRAGEYGHRNSETLINTNDTRNGNRSFKVMAPILSNNCLPEACKMRKSNQSWPMTPPRHPPSSPSPSETPPFCHSLFSSPSSPSELLCPPSPSPTPLFLPSPECSTYSSSLSSCSPDTRS